MPETSPTTSDEAGVTRTPTGEISQPSTSTQETIVRPPPTPTTTPSSETKTDAQPAKPEKSLLNEKGPTGAPEKYEDFKVPDGFTLDPDVAKEATAIFKEINASQADAQKLVDFYHKLTKEAVEAPINHYMDTRQEWRDLINADPEIGGSKLNGTKASIGKLLDSVGDSKLTEAFREAMDYTGAGDNPAVVRMLNAFAKRLTEGGPVRGGGPSTEGQRAPGEGRPSAAQALYPNLPSSQRG
jgi:hypothetical protein